MRRLILTALLAGFVSTAKTWIVWDQSNFDASAIAYIDTEFSDPGSRSFSTYLAMDFNTSRYPGGWTMDKVTTYYSRAQSNWVGTVTQARLSVFEKVGPLPQDFYHPENGQIVPITVTNILGNLHVVADLKAAGISRWIAEGDWWVVLTPIVDYNVHRQAFHMGTTPDTRLLDETAVRTPGYWQGPDWGSMSALLGAPTNIDASVLIESFIPEPGTLLAIGAGLAALALRRRSRYNGESESVEPQSRLLLRGGNKENAKDYSNGPSGRNCECGERAGSLGSKQLRRVGNSLH